MFNYSWRYIMKNIEQTSKSMQAIIFDIDGVLIRPPYFYNTHMETEWYVWAREELDSFFKSDIFLSCLEGKWDIKDFIWAFLDKCGWKKSVEEYLTQQFQFEAKYLDMGFLGKIQEFRKQWIKCYLWTDQEKYRAEYLLDTLNFSYLFDGHFISSSIGYRKKSPEYWKYVSLYFKKIDVLSNEVMFFDDIQYNVDEANRHWFSGYVFTSVDDFAKYERMIMEEIWWDTVVDFWEEWVDAKELIK